MRHIIIKQATSGESYFEATVDFSGEKLTMAKYHLEKLLCGLEWSLDGEFTYEVLLKDIPRHARKYCADYGCKLETGAITKAEAIAKRAYKKMATKFQDLA